jgi:hypothetical protein
VSAEALLQDQRWRTLTWRRGTKGPLKAAFAAVRVRVADGPAVRLHGRNNQHMPGEEVWLVGERRSSGERKFYLSNVPAEVSLKRLASAIKARWVCEQAHQQMKEELGLDHFEGRSWTGLHRHALMTLIAFAFLQHQRLAAAGRGKKKRTTASAEPAGDPGRPHPAHAGSILATRHMPPLPTTDHADIRQTRNAKVVLGPRCGARTRSGSSCRSPAVRGKVRCRMHGGATGSGAPKGERNGNYRHGLFTQKVLEERRRVAVLIRQSRKLLSRCTDATPDHRDTDG